VTARRGFLLRVGTAIVLVTGVMLLPAVPALAAADLKLQDIGSVGLTVGSGSQTLSIRVRNDGDDPSTQTQLTVTIPLAEQQIKIGSNNACRPNGNIVSCQVPVIGPKQTQTLIIPMSPPASSGLQPGQEANGRGKAVLENGEERDFSVTLRGANQAQSVTEVSGTVVDSANTDPVSGVVVLLKDSGGHEYSITTGNSGGYRFTANAEKPISPGQLSLTASKEGFETATVTKDGVSGRGVTNARISLKAVASVAPSAPTVSESAAAPSESAAPAAAPTNTSADSGPGMLAWLIIGLGILLLLLGGGAIAYMLIKRKSDQQEPDEDEYADTPTRVGAGAVAGAQGAYHGGPAPTMVARDGRPGMNDATAIVPPEPLDEFPDPYAAPMPAGGYGQPGYGEPGYGGDRAYGDQGYDRGYSDDRGYGGYSDNPRGGGRYGSDEPTGRLGAGGGGYPAAGSYPSAEHDQYRRPASPGYDQPRAGDYRDQRTSHYDATPPGRARSVDWLDD
jgi:hypothetical protein